MQENKYCMSSMQLFLLHALLRVYEAKHKYTNHVLIMHWYQGLVGRAAQLTPVARYLDPKAGTKYWLTSLSCSASEPAVLGIP